jgi:hypothetical protein
LGFVYFDPENTMIVLELNNYGGTLLAEMTNLFDSNNSYGSNIFVRYKHRVDAPEEKIGLKIGENKNLLIKDYQDLMGMKSFNINNAENINEITTFVKHITTAGNIRYAADGSAHDDTVMSLINSTSIYKKQEFQEMVDDWMNRFESQESIRYINDCMNQIEFTESVDYKQLLDVKNRTRYLPKIGYGVNKGGSMGYGRKR